LAAPPPAKGAVDVTAVLTKARGVLGSEPDAAAAMAREVLILAPARPEARLLLGAALRRSGDLAGAVATLTPLAAGAPGAWGIQFELGAAFAVLGDTAAAISHLERAAALNPQSSLALHALGDQLAIRGDHKAAAEAQGRATPGSLTDARLREGVAALIAGDHTRAAAILKGRFDLHPTDPLAVRLLADAALGLGATRAAEALLRPILETAPDFMAARHAYVRLQIRNSQPLEALAHAERLLAQAPGTGLFLSLRAETRRQTGDQEGARSDFVAALEFDPDEPRLWLGFGHVLRALGDQAGAVAAYRESLARDPSLGEAYWSLADLKVFRFSTAERSAMDAALATPGASDDDRIHLHFALGKSLEDDGDHAAAFDHYAKANALRRTLAPYDWRANRAFVRRALETFTPAFFAAREGLGDPAPDPIFILGLPRSGSTLVEQILASHSAVEGLSELPDLMAIAGQITDGADVAARDAYPALLGDLPAKALAELGAEYLRRTRVYRRTGRPFFVDKAPNNVLQLGLICLILPGAKIIDARRDPMACGFSIFKQNFARGAAYGCDLADIGRYHRDYLSLMDHFDAVLPGRVHRVIHEDLVRDPEKEVARLLAYCGLDFEPACLRFYETARPVRTASSEQVRRPLNADGLEHWRNFEPWLGQLSAELG
jgi:tetratricopeptide (TPR) repeat protein